MSKIVQKEVRLETDRLILRQFTLDDADAMFRNWAGDPEVAIFMPYEAHTSVDQTKKVLIEWLEHYSETEQNKRIVLAIVLKITGELIGSIDYVETDVEAKAADVGYQLGKQWWHNGYAVEALKALLKYCFEECGFNRLWAMHNALNVNSGAVMRKSGMKYEGTFRKDRVRKGMLRDSVQYAILAEDYFGKLQKGKIICIYGAVCAGKTHYAKKLAKERHAVVLNHDEIGVPLFGIDPARFEVHYEKIRKYFFQKALDIMETGIAVILDWGFWNRADRKETTDYFTKRGYAVEWHGITITDTALRRNVQSRHAEIATGRTDVYPADGNLLAKAAEIIEQPSEDEMDVWIRME